MYYKLLSIFCDTTHNTVIEEDLATDEKEESLEQINAIASALPDNQSRKLKRKAKGAMTIIQDIADTLPPTAPMVAICHQLSDTIERIC
ncbi:MAG: hypothetical protein QNJ41_28705 [Xenococcaceae cyanobacterium MO_188.B32]|nr:hypothetical protein [Xenococcaceae cyanobacterium MO_188.B32]